MITLSIDTSATSASIGLFKKVNESYEQLFLKSWKKERSHSEVITSYFIEALNQNNLNTEDLNLICLGKGPGSFTGIRVALNFAKTISYSHNIPIYAINSLAPLAFKNRELHSQILVLNNAFRNMIYGSAYSCSPFTEIHQPFAKEPGKLSSFISNFNNTDPILVIGNAFSLYKNLFTKLDLDRFITNEKSDSNVCAKSIFDYYLQDKGPATCKWNEVLPLYIRGSEAEEKLKLKLSNNQRNN